MTRGNQRDLAREKAAKKAGKGKSASETAANAGMWMKFVYRYSQRTKVRWSLRLRGNL